MKTFLQTKQHFITLMLMIMISASGMISQAQTGTGGVPGSGTVTTTPSLSFTNASLYSGQAGTVGAIYRFPSVNSNLDAFVKINDRSSSLVKLESIDLTNTGFSKAFQPEISYNNGSVSSASNWWMEFEISFVNKNTTTPATISTFKATALDIDGDNNRLREWVSFNNLSSYTMESNSPLTVTSLMQTISGILQPVTTFTGVTNQYNGIDTAQTGLMVTTTYDNKSSFRFRVGASTSGSASVTDRMYAVWFKDFTYNAPQITTLPVELISFTASLNSNNKVDLKWRTASENNVSHFTIEKSYDGKSFSDAGLVFAYGNSTTEKSYSFSDNISNTQQFIIYYRLRSTDIDGKTQYSEIRLIRIGKKGEEVKMVTYPNPVTNELRVTVPASWQGKELLLEVFNQNGQRIKAAKSGSASQTETINVSDLAKGFYVVKASCGEETAQQKVVKN
ncbi:MAG: T9SS type A sorting domain-containing protein [Chitinophagaceae bacterium]|nr:T9SS type A sorting domain-containing protein [Chitinophagaceae bacterium]